MKKLLIFCLVVFVIWGATGCKKKSSDAYTPESKKTEKYIKAHFIDLNEGKCTVFELPNGECMIVDCGATNDFPKVYEYIHNLGIHIIDYLVITKTDSFHMGSARKLIQDFTVNELYISDYALNIGLYKSTVESAKEAKCTVNTSDSGVGILDDNKLSISIVSSENIKNSSVSLIAAYKNNTFFIEGDGDIKAENDMLTSFGGYIKSDVLSVADSGSQNASSPAFIQKVSPRYAIIPIIKGENKKTSKSVLKSLEILGAYVLRTDVNGTIMCTGDGKEISIKTEK